MNKKFKNIIIANDAETFAFIIGAIDDEVRRTAKMRKEHFLSSRFLFWEGDNKIVITPFSIELSILNQAQSLGYKNVENWYPSKMGINLSDAIIEDKILLKNLKKIIKDNPGVILSAYSYTKNFAHLTEILRKENLKFHVDQQPQEKAEWTIDYLGSKVGFRTEMEKLQNIPQPEFFICKNKKEITEATVIFFERNESCVIKANSGEGGWGVLMIRKEDYMLENDLKKELQRQLNKDTIWSKGPFVVEGLIPSLENTESSPSLEIFIDNSGFKITYACNQVINSSGTFLGILMGRKSLKNGINIKINTIAEIIAKRYFELGYRGFFDIDFIVSKEGIPYPIETNVRRTGGTHVFDLTKKLFGKSWFNKTSVLSADSFCYGKTILPTRKILQRMSEVTFPIKGKKKGVVIVAVNGYAPYFSFVIFAPTKLEVLKIHEKLTSIWKKGTLNK